MARNLNPEDSDYYVFHPVEELTPRQREILEWKMAIKKALIIGGYFGGSLVVLGLGCWIGCTFLYWIISFF